ncbi:MAG: acetylornithine deacetylase, partial [Gemmatimonadaceae bacterium]|nr:acetylornithine deacetylase [Gemmatimonadaceae bacterium]
MTAPARGDATALVRELVRIDSRNPSLTPGAPGEAAVARTLAAVLEGWGFRVEVHE